VQLAIPQAPRPVRLWQVPGALRRVGAVAAVALLVAGGLGLGGRAAQRSLSAEREFLAVAQPVKGRVTEVTMPEGDGPAKLRVIYQLNGDDYAASGVLLEREVAAGLGLGAPIELLVDPQVPGKAKAALWVRARDTWWWLEALGVGLGLLGGALFVARELRRAVRREVAPLRVGALVWLTPEGTLPDTKAELRFPAHYYRDDVKHAVTARGRPGRRPVRNGEKVLAAVVPSEPTWARVIDEDLARTLGWYR
jgi:hypothetical protein